MAIGTYVLELVHYSAGWVVDATLTPNARITEVAWELNGAGNMTFELPTNDANASAIQPLTREIRVKRNGTIVWWGLVMRTTVKWQTMTVQCERLFAYYNHRYFGVKTHTNLILNGSFETFTGTPDVKGVVTFANWQAVNVTIDAVSTHQFLAPGEVAGVTHYGLNMAQNTGNSEAYIFQRFDFATGAQATTYRFTAQCHQRADTYQSTLSPQQFEGAYGNRAMCIGRAKLVKSNYPGGAGIGPADIPLPTNNYPTWVEQYWAPGVNGGGLGVSHPFVQEITVPPNTTGCLELRLYCPKGDIVWDDIECYSDDAFTVGMSTVGDILNAVNTLAQTVSEGKNDLHITFSGAGTGPKANFVAKYTDHMSIGDVFMMFARMQGIGDFDIVDATRVMTYYASGKGSTLGSYPVQTGASSNITDLSYNDDGSSSANSIVALNPGQTLNPKEVYANDVSTFGGNVFEQIVIGQQSWSDYELNGVAQATLAKTKNLARALTVTLTPDQQTYIDNVNVGDRVPVTISRGYLNLSGANWRVVRKSLDPTNDTLTLTLNP
jgi:hypothetical protein